MRTGALCSAVHQMTSARPLRKILHIDLDAFYAAIEQRDDQALRGQPIAIGGRSRRGVVMTASYEARAYGVRSAMPVFKALRLCPQLILVAPRFPAYKAASRSFRQILQDYADLIEPASLDEAYLDVTLPKRDLGSATAIAAAIRRDCFREIGITASAGISFNKFLAKLASEMNKPDGQTTIRPDQALSTLADLPISRFHGVGPATSAKLIELGFVHGRDIQRLTEIEATQRLGSVGSWLWRLAQALDSRPVEPFRVRKSLSIERTLEHNMMAVDEISSLLGRLASELYSRYRQADFQGRTITLKMKYSDFSIQTRSLTHSRPVDSEPSLQQIARNLLLSQPTVPIS